MSLRDIQQQFIRGMYDSGVDATDFVVSSDRQSAQAGLAIYRGSVRGGLLQALADIFPVLKRLLGDEAFEGVGRRYIQAHPSRSSDLADYGADYPDFIEGFAPLSEFGYLPDVARLEWLWHRVFHEADDSGLDLNRLGALSPEAQSAVKFRMPCASRMLRSTCEVDVIWQANQPGVAASESIKLVPGDYRFLIWRHGFDMRVDRLTEADWDFLHTLQSTKTFSEAIAQYLQRYPTADVGERFAHVVSCGWLADFE